MGCSVRTGLSEQLGSVCAGFLMWKREYEKGRCVLWLTN